MQIGGRKQPFFSGWDHEDLGIEYSCYRLLAWTWVVVGPSKPEKGSKQVDKHIGLSASLRHVETSEFYTIKVKRQGLIDHFRKGFQLLNQEPV